MKRAALFLTSILIALGGSGATGTDRELSELLEERPQHPVLLDRAASKTYDSPERTAFSEAAFLALDRYEESVPLRMRAYFASRWIESLLVAGLRQEAVLRFEALPPQLAAECLSSSLEGVRGSLDGLPLRVDMPELRVQLAAAYYLEGRWADLESVVDAFPPEHRAVEADRCDRESLFDDDEEHLRWRRSNAWQTIRLLATPRQHDPFDELTLHFRCFSPRSVAVWEALGRLAADRGYPEIGAYGLDRARGYSRSERQSWMGPLTVEALAPRVAEWRERYAENHRRFQEAVSQVEAPRSIDRVASIVEALLEAPLSFPYEERVLDRGLEADPAADTTSKLDDALVKTFLRAQEGSAKVFPAWHGTETSEGSAAAEGLESDSAPQAPRSRPPGAMIGQPLGDERSEWKARLGRVALPDDFRALRAERMGDLAVAVGTSHALDPMGEVSDGGYWVIRSADGGRTWSRPFYTGLKCMRPYQLRAVSDVPLIAGERLELEVTRQELDEESITFPPIMLRFQGETSRLVLSVPWADLVRDADADGLTDLEEERLLTDPRRPDTDGDGLEDGVDRVPHVPYRPGKSREALAMEQVLNVVGGGWWGGADRSAPVGSGPEATRCPELGDQSSETLFLIGNRRQFESLCPRGRLVVLTEDEAERAQERIGVFYPHRFELFSLDHEQTSGWVIWSVKWAGGEYALRWKGDRWELVPTRRWIT